MRVGLFGFGRAGKAVASVFLQNKDASLSWIVRRSQTLQHRSAPEFLGISTDDPGVILTRDEQPIEQLLDEMPVDVIVDFSSVDSIGYYGEAAAQRGISIVTAISGYHAITISYLRGLATRTRVLWSPNITIGVNFLILASKVLKMIAPYTDVEVMEEHFRAKKEVSGTAKIIANTLGMDEQMIKSVRAGGIVGRHEVLFGFPYQTVRLVHESISREAFGNGALFAAKNIITKPTGFYTMEDFLVPYLSQVMSHEEPTPAPASDPAAALEEAA